MKNPLHPGGFTLLELVVVIAILALVAVLVIGKYEKVQDQAQQTVALAALKTTHEAFMGSPAAPGFVQDMKRVPGFLPLKILDMRVSDLFVQGNNDPYDLTSQRGWRGPYLEHNTNGLRQGKFPKAEDRDLAGDLTFAERKFYVGSTSPYGAEGDPAVIDPWGNPIVLQFPDEAAFTKTSTPAKRLRYARLVSAGANGKLETPLDSRTAGLKDGGTMEARGDDLVSFLYRADVYEDEEAP